MTDTDRTRITRKVTRHLKRAWSSRPTQITIEIDREGAAEAHYCAQGRYWFSPFDREGGCFGHFPAGPRDKA
jgi:hypothetical protein